MARNYTSTDCFTCRKHREHGALLPGGAVGEDNLVAVSHAAPGAARPRR
ncbi:MAG TPA: hypothetical protein VLW50_01360 [Streptosporangiaceae bacterium]|nr:hypothetical protein [Streptosporangiaceae bacterium]